MDSILLAACHSSTTSAAPSPPRMLRTASECSKNPSSISTSLMAARSSASRSSTSSSTLSLCAAHTPLSSGYKKNIADFSAVFLPSVTPLDNYYHNLQPAGMAAVYWRHYTAFTTIGEKVTKF